MINCRFNLISNLKQSQMHTGADRDFPYKLLWTELYVFIKPTNNV